MSLPEPRRRNPELPMLDASTSVPVPEAAYAEPEARRRWTWVLGGAVVLLVTIAAIRGDAPRTAVITDRAVSPLPAAAETALPTPGEPTYIEIDAAGEEVLEVCDWDYCLVHDFIGEERIAPFLYEISLSEARAIANRVVVDWDVDSVTVTSEVIPGESGGFYDPNEGTITLDEPLIAWSLVHELAHHIVFDQQAASGHGSAFLGVLDTLAGGR